METSPVNLKSILEALVFAADEPVTIKQLEEIFHEAQEDGQGPTLRVDEIRRTIAELNAEYEEQGRAYRILQVGGGYQFATRPEYAEWVGKLYKEKGKRKLSHSALETLAIISYRQPVTKPEIESIRGVNCDYVMRTLLERGLTTITGRAHTVGRPLLYGTTREFLKHFGINELSDLPKPREIEEIIEEEKLEAEQQILDADRIEEKLAVEASNEQKEPVKLEIPPAETAQPLSTDDGTQPEAHQSDSVQPTNIGPI